MKPLSVFLGAIAGVAATWIMDGVGTVIYEKLQSDSSRELEKAVQPEPVVSLLARRILTAADIEPTEESVKLLGTSLHWAFGVFGGVAYALMRSRWRSARTTLGQPVAMSMLMIDEFGFPAIGVAAPPSRYPKETHLRAFISHVAFGLSVAIVYEGLDRIVTG